MQLNKYNLYSMNVGISSVDEADTCIRNLQTMNKYDEILDFLKQNFGDIQKKR